MQTLVQAVRDWYTAVIAQWNRFWFSAIDPIVLSLIRICTGAMLLYTHLVWSRGLEAFFGDDAWIRPDVLKYLPPRPGAWEYFSSIHSPTLLWTVHIAALIVFAMLTLGLCSRVTSVLSFLCAVSYINRVPGAQFGLDDTEIMLAAYLMIGPCGACWSLDNWLKTRRATRQGRAGDSATRSAALSARATSSRTSDPGLLNPTYSVSANIAIRLIQLHMCLMYLFAGMGKLRGDGWWDGTAFWLAIANQEYQTLDLTWLHAHPYLVNFLTLATVFWETFYCALIWPRLTRPLMLLIAVIVHLGIGFGMGLMTFGLIMLVGNTAFLSPTLVRGMAARISRRRERAGQGSAAALTHQPRTK